MPDISKLIRENIEQTAARLSGFEVTTAESMIPAMNVEPYAQRKLDMAYGTLTSMEKLDVFYPDASNACFPVFVEVHGGAWYFGQKRSIEFEPFLVGLERGYACVSLGYTLAPVGHYPLPVKEIRSAIRYLRAHAQKLRLDPNRIVLWGGSAGAHLAALAATTAEEPDLFGQTGSGARPNALALWYGCFDYARNGRLMDDWIYQNFFGLDDLADIQAELEEASPLNHLTPETPPTFLQHGMADSIVPYTQSLGYAQSMAERGLGDRCRLELIDGCEHADARLFARANVEHLYDVMDEWFKR